ncbi:uncharacterized protein LOC135216750 [Macrobrachium nipponense]|uniref:uncharacterized protein LOC135216750 n=1 Tax=Macrobrachium nipponense TaxID=159736 RepID=UPI0030C88C31
MAQLPLYFCIPAKFFPQFILPWLNWCTALAGISTQVLHTVRCVTCCSSSATLCDKMPRKRKRTLSRFDLDALVNTSAFDKVLYTTHDEGMDSDISHYGITESPHPSPRAGPSTSCALPSQSQTVIECEIGTSGSMQAVITPHKDPLQTDSDEIDTINECNTTVSFATNVKMMMRTSSSRTDVFCGSQDEQDA